MDTIRHYASFPATGVSLRQMVQFGEKPSTGAPPPDLSCIKPCLDLILTLPQQGHSSAHHSSLPRNSPFDSPTASKSFKPCPMDSTRCRR